MGSRVRCSRMTMSVSRHLVRRGENFGHTDVGVSRHITMLKML